MAGTHVPIWAGGPFCVGSTIRLELPYVASGSPAVITQAVSGDDPWLCVPRFPVVCLCRPATLPSRNYSCLIFNRQCRCQKRTEPLQRRKPLRYGKLEGVHPAGRAPGHISGLPICEMRGLLRSTGSVNTASFVCKLKFRKQICAVHGQNRRGVIPGPATMFRHQASNTVVADQRCLLKQHSGTERSESSSSNCGVLGSLPPGRLTRREGTSGIHPKPAPTRRGFLSSNACDKWRPLLRHRGKLHHEHVDLSLDRGPRRATGGGTPFHGVPPRTQRSDQPGQLWVDSGCSFSRYRCKRYRK